MKVLLIAVAVVAVFGVAFSPRMQPPACEGHGDVRPGCPGDPAPLGCTREGGHGNKKCSCKATGCQDGMTTGETTDCPRYCDKKCYCHLEESCESGAHQH